MKKVVFISILFSLLFSSCVTTSEHTTKPPTSGEVSFPNDSRTERYLKYGNGYFKIRIGSNVVYKFMDEEYYTFSQFVSLSYYDISSKKYMGPTGSFFNIDNAPVKYAIESDREFITIDDKYSTIQYIFKKAGVGKINIKIGEVIYPIEINIIELPLSKSDEVDAVIEKIGFPSKEVDVFVRWPDIKSENGIIYSTTSGKHVSSIIAKQYFFKQYPFLTFSKVSGGYRGMEIGYNTTWDGEMLK